MLKSLHAHGGKRKGARRPPLYNNTAMTHKNIRLDAESIAFYTQHGNGNLSKGIRDYWRKVQKGENTL